MTCERTGADVFWMLVSLVALVGAVAALRTAAIEAERRRVVEWVMRRAWRLSETHSNAAPEVARAARDLAHGVEP
jgi:hypothetical protein